MGTADEWPLMDCASVEIGERHGEEKEGRQVLTRGRLSQKDSRRIPRHEWAETFFRHGVDEIREHPHSANIQFRVAPGS